MERQECYLGFPPLPEPDEISYRILNDPPCIRWRMARELFHIKNQNDRESLVEKLRPHLHIATDFRIKERIALALKVLHWPIKHQDYLLVQGKGVFKTSEIMGMDLRNTKSAPYPEFFPVIDFHVHPKTPDITFFSDMREAGVTHGVILATDTDPEDVDRPEISDMLQAAYNKSTQSRIMPFENLKKHIKENLCSTTHVSNQDVADWISDYPDKLTGFGSVNLSKDRLYVEKKLDRLLELGMKGINLLPHLQFFNPAKSDNIKMLLEFCSDTKLFILTHSGCGSGPFEILELCRNAHPVLWESCLKKYPDVVLIMAHFGAYTTRIPGIWLYEALQFGKKYKNVYAELSSVGWILDKNCVVNEIRKTIGFDRVLFGTGYPKPLVSSMTVASMVSGIKANLRLTEKEKRKVLGENAAKLLGIYYW